MKELFNLIYQQTVDRWGYYEKPKFDTKLFVDNRTGVYDYRCHTVYLNYQLDPDDRKNYPILGANHESFLLSPLYAPDFDAISPLEVDARLSEIEREIPGFLDDSSLDIYHRITCQGIRGIETYIRSAEICSKLLASFGD